MRKDSMVKKEKEEDKTRFCAVCSEISELMCGKCQSIYYCKVDHQRIHWKSHSKNCKSANERRSDHLQYKRILKTQIFSFLADQEINKAIKKLNQLIEEQRKFIQKQFPDTEDIETEIQLGSSVCVLIRLLIATKQFSTAQDILSQYFKDKNYFLSNINTVKSKEELDAMDEKERRKWTYLISGKLKLISSLANLMHQLIRNSVDMFSILIAHFQKVYGIDSLQLSNVYFYTANYLNFLNQNTKALACFLKAAKMRKQKGGTAYYNAALLLLKAGRKKKALQFFHKALQLIQQEKNNQNNYVVAQIHQNIALIYMRTGQSKAMIDYFQKAYFYYVRNNYKEKAENIMKLFMIIRKQAKEEGADDMKTIQFSKERKDKRPVQMLNSKNKDKYRNADKIAEQDEKKVAEWLIGFKELKLNYNQPSIIKPPRELEYLFGNQLNKNGDQEEQSLNTSQNNRYAQIQSLNMDLEYMKSLTSIEVGYLHELNRLLIESKEPAAYYDIVENSNFYQNVSGDRVKLNNFYRLNNKLVRPTDLERKLLMQINQDDFQNEQQFQEEYNIIPKKGVPTPTPKLDLSKLKELRDT